MHRILIALFAFVLSVSAASQTEKVIYLENLKELILQTQDMRGKTNVFLNGGSFAQFNVYKDRKEIEKRFRTLHYDFKLVGVETDKKLANIETQMQSLNDVAFELKPQFTFNGYSALIEAMISLGGEAQENLFKEESERHQRTGNLMMTKIIPLTEWLGKLRGIGSGVIVRGESEADEIEAMREYTAEILDLLQATSMEMKTLGKSNAKKYPKELQAWLNKYALDVKTYVSLSEDKLMNEDKDIHLNADDYFMQGTDLITKTMDLYEMNGDALKN